MLMEHFLCDDLGGKHNVCGIFCLTLVNLGELSMAFLWSIHEVSRE
ncbi:hypothetical protein ATE90_1130 [Polaribacter sp. Hel1_33_96]|jgi:hypothetical protein|nr:hypothetical protein ATE90_1130 [Polaribacter sp. Hel1_33_96]